MEKLKIMWSLSSRRESESKKSTARVRVALPGLFFVVYKHLRSERR